MPSLLYFYNMLPVIGAGDRFTDISIVPHPKGFRKVVEKVLQLRKGPLCEGTPAKRVGRDLTWRHFMKMSLPQSASLTALPLWHFVPPPPYRGSLSRRGSLLSGSYF